MKSTYVVSSVTCSARAARVAHGDHLRSAANRRVGAKTAPQHLERVTTTSRRRPRTIHAHGRPGAAISNAYASPQASNSPASANPGTSYSEHKPKTPPPDLPSLLLPDFVCATRIAFRLRQICITSCNRSNKLASRRLKLTSPSLNLTETF